MQQNRSCLVVVLSIFLLIYLVLFGGTTYANLRLWWVNYQILTVAEQLGYTPDALLRHEMDSRDWGFLLDTNCDVNLYYTTTLSPAEFGARLGQVLPETRGQDWSQPMHPSSLSGRIDGLNVRATIPLPALEVVIVHDWFSDDDKTDMSIYFYDLANVTAPVDYKGSPITGNIVELYKFGGTFQVWNCPTRITENPNLPRN
jgi:hypothetical protein